MISKQRIWEIDFLRGIAIVLMISFHIIYDLVEFYHYNLDYLNGFWFFVGRSAAVLFIILAGISSNLSSNIFKQALKVLTAAMCITIITYFIFTATYVRFGILHLLASCMFISISFHKLKNQKAIIPAALLFGTAFFLISPFIDGIPPLEKKLPALVLLPLGVTWPSFGSIDYYPLFPWAGFFFYGLALGKLFYRKGRSFFSYHRSIFSFLGRRSLFIYLMHQPVIISLLFVIHQVLDFLRNFNCIYK